MKKSPTFKQLYEQDKRQIARCVAREQGLSTDTAHMSKSELSAFLAGAGVASIYQFNQ